LLSAVLLLFCKEDASLYLIAFGIYAVLFRKSFRFGTVAICLGVFWLLFTLSFAIPIFSQGRHYHTFESRYPQLGSSFQDIILNVIKHPFSVLKLLFDKQSIINWGYLLIPLAALPLFHWTSWVLIFPSTLELFLSQFRPMKTLALHYPWFVIPFYFLGAILSLRRLMNRYSIFRSPLFVRGLMFYLFFTGVFFHYYFDPKNRVSHTYNWYFVSPSPLGRNFNFDYYQLNDHDRRAKDFIHQNIPKEASLSVVHRFSHDVSDRFVLRMFPDAQDAKFIFMDIFWDQAWVLSQIDLKRFKERIFLYLEEIKFGVREYEDGYALLERDFSTSKNLKVAQDLVEFFEVELTEHRVGKTVIDHQAYNKRARWVASGKFPSGYVFYGTGQNFPKGPLEVKVRLRAESRRKDGVICRIQLLKVFSNEVLSEKIVQVQDVISLKDYQYITLKYDNPEPQLLAVQVFYEGQDDLWIDHFRWICPGLSWNDLKKNLEIY
jgi:hypothetical protein